MTALCVVEAQRIGIGAEANAPLDNPLATESTLPYHLPPFDRIKDEHFPPMFERGMAEALAEIAAIAKNPETPTFANTIVALERAGQLLDRIDRIFSNLNAAHTNSALQKIETDIAPKIAAHRDAIHLNATLFERIEAIHAQRDALGLDAESRFLLERYYKDFVRAGARLPDADKPAAGTNVILSPQNDYLKEFTGRRR